MLAHMDISIPDYMLPSVSVQFLANALRESYEILRSPQDEERIFNSLQIIGDGKVPFHPFGRNRSPLYICSYKDSFTILTEVHDAFVCALVDHNDDLSKFGPYSERSLAVCGDGGLFRLCSEIQALFITMSTWQSELDYVVDQGGTLQDLLEAAAKLLNEPLFCMEVSGDVCAAVNMPDDHSKLNSILSKRLFPKESLDKMLTMDRQDNLFEISNDLNPMLMEVLQEDSCDYMIVALDRNDENLPLESTRHLFSLLTSRAQIIADGMWTHQKEINSPHFSFLTDLLEGKKFNRMALNEHLREMNIPIPSQFKLLRFNLGDYIQKTRMAELVERAVRLNDGNCYGFIHNNSLVVLLYAKQDILELTHERTSEDVAKHVLCDFDVKIASSQVFDQIVDMPLAYRQTIIAETMRSMPIDPTVIPNEDTAPALIFFEYYIIYYLIGATQLDEELLDFSFSQNIIQKISTEDQAHGTNNLDVLWTFLNFERNATKTAEKLGVHRNTVLYRIEKIEENYNIDLSSPETRERMLLDFRVHTMLKERSAIKGAFEGI